MGEITDDNRLAFVSVVREGVSLPHTQDYLWEPIIKQKWYGMDWRIR